jgi:Terpene cyclase DEP1
MLKSTDVPVRSSFNAMKPIYLLLTLVGSIAPWFWLLQDLAVLLSPTLFLQKAFENNVAAAVASDLLISAVAFFCFVWIELKRLDVSRLWLLVYVGLTFGVGLSCALPFFLYSRGQVLEQNKFRQHN